MTEWEDDQDKLKEEGDGYVFVCMDENVKVLSCRSGKMAPWYRPCCSLSSTEHQVSSTGKHSAIV